MREGVGADVGVRIARDGEASQGGEVGEGVLGVVARGALDAEGVECGGQLAEGVDDELACAEAVKVEDQVER